MSPVRPKVGNHFITFIQSLVATNPLIHFFKLLIEGWKMWWMESRESAG